MSRTVGTIWDSSFLNHHAGEGHPECPERLVAIRAVLERRELWESLQQLDIREATREELERNHTTSHVTKVLEAEGLACTVFDGDTQSSPGTTQAALRAVGGGIDLARAVWRGDLESGFLLGRPPGHHAEKEFAMGFCYFNNIALAARALLEEGLSRILIVDWDIHHGNGTQHSFEDDPRVLFFSMHQAPFYPGTGRLKDIGVGKGEGFTVNVPLPPTLGDDEYLFCFERILRPLAEQFRPEIILLSAGYDAHRLDPLGSMNVTSAGFAALATELLSISQDLCEGKLVAFLEGGYDLEGLSTAVATTFEVMLGEETECSGDAEHADPLCLDILDRLRSRLSGHWSL